MFDFLLHFGLYAICLLFRAYTQKSSIFFLNSLSSKAYFIIFRQVLWYYV